ncbi:MAG: tetratricopeptide repeat protein [Pseudomonadota bacterium]
MLKNLTYSFLLLSAAVLWNGSAWAEDSPSLDQVYQAAHAGKMDEAQRMMGIVLKEHPNSAKAHFVEAELLARQGQMENAETELRSAERLKPDLSFAKPEAVQDLKNRIASAHRVSSAPGDHTQLPSSSNFPWGILLLGLGVIAVIFLIIRAKSRKPATYPGNYQPGMQNVPASPAPMQPYGGGTAPMGPAGGGMGSGIMGGLATGAAVGVGLVAGEALAHRFMDGGHADPVKTAPATDSWGSTSNDMGGSDFGIADNSSWDDSSSVADNSSDGGGDWG